MSHTEPIVKIQSLWRKYISNLKNIYKQLKRPEIIRGFENYLVGYHCFNHSPLKEANWEMANEEIMTKNRKIRITKTAQGNHKSGCDIETTYFNISNKTSKMEKTKIAISSYRLTNVCNSKNIGDIETVIQEIKNRSNSYEYYSILVRKEIGDKQLLYTWYVIPADYYLFRPNHYAWQKTYGRKNKEECTGYSTETIHNCSMKIQFNMSSQLWIYIEKERIQQFLVAEYLIDFEKIHHLSFSTLGESLRT
jgi:hypothetical protein